MSNEGFLVTNPKGNNVDLEIWIRTPAGGSKRLFVVKPGNTAEIRKQTVEVREIRRPARLEQTPDGAVRSDTRPDPPRVFRRANSDAPRAAAAAAPPPG